MVKYIANVEFKDRYTWEIIPKGTELELTEERAEEIINVLGEGALTNLAEVKEEVKGESPAPTPVEDKKEAKEVE